MKNMLDTDQLEASLNDLIDAANVLKEHCRDPLASPPVSPDSTRVRRNLLTATARLQRLLFQPTEFVQHLATGIQLLACLKWLGEFHVLAYIPLSGCVSIRDVADLADVPQEKLHRVVRLMAMAGFMHEPLPGLVEHTPVSASFVNRPTLLDASMFLGETVAPFALHMATTTSGRHEDSPTDSQSDDSSGPSSSSSSRPVSWRTSWLDKQAFQSTYQQHSKLQRQWPAYFRCIGDASCGSVALLNQLNWASLGSACIVDVGGQSLASVTDLAKLHPHLHFVVQTEDSAPTSNHMAAITGDLELSARISTCKRASGTPQTVQPAAVYLIRLSHHNPLVPLRSRIKVELRAHLGVLEANRSALLILMVQMLPEPGTVDEHTERMARLRDLTLLQLVDGGDLIEEELASMVDGVRDDNGRLAIVKKLRCRESAEVAVGVKYQNDENRMQQLAFMPENI